MACRCAIGRLNDQSNSFSRTLYRFWNSLGEWPRVHLESEVFGIDRVFFLISRRFHHPEAGRITILELKEDGVWLPDSPGASKLAQEKVKNRRNSWQ
ncbi:hypothetical protein [Ignatzschineria indica]|uniref:hypothetical protein n=1 Tax=Ignatzschineria indica TaxID=472583 RepID=UPI003628DE56